MAQSKASDLSDEELQAEMSLRTAAKRDEAHAIFIAKVQPFVDAGWGKPAGEKLVAVLESNYLDLPRGSDGEPDLRVHAEAAMRAARRIQDALASRLVPAAPVTPAPTVAAP